MKQVIKKSVAEAHNIDTTPLIYTLIIDGNNLLKISSVDKRMNNKGEEYGIIYQFLLQAKLLLQKKDFNFCYCFWDGEKSGQLRYQYYQDYKLNRDKKYELSGSKSEYDKQIDDYCKKVINYHKHHKKEVQRGETDEENFERQRSILCSLLEELFVRQVMCDEVEGDDLIAHYVNNKKPNERIVIVSGDRDLTQLISDEVTVYIPSLKKFITPQNHIQELGYTHENVLIKKIICGDSSDNIKGIKGVGDKTFFDLFPEAITTKIDLETILERSKQNMEERIKSKKKPLESTKNIIERVTVGCQGKNIYEVNDKIINLKKPLLTKEAIEELDGLMYVPLDPENRNFKNVYNIIEENNMIDLLDDTKFSSFFSSYHKLIDNEVKFFNLNIS